MEHYDLYAKCFLFARTPIQWAGGVLEAYKDSGSTSTVESYRSLYVASQPGKLLHKALRQKMGRSLEQTLHPLHCGPRLGSPVTLPAMAVHLLNRLFLAKGVSCAVCLDTKSAYYGTVRQMAVGQLDTEEGMIRIFQAVHLDLEV